MNVLGFGEPALLYTTWAKSVERTMDTPVAGSVDAIIKTTFQYCWESLSLSRTSESNNQVLQLFRNISYATQDGFYHIRGIIVHHFNDDFGVIQTKYGKVLYERNIAYTMKEDSLSLGGTGVINNFNWRRCKSSNLAFPKHVVVKLHARIGKFKVKFC